MEIMDGNGAMAEALRGWEDSPKVGARNGERVYLGPKLLQIDPLRARITTRPVSARIVAAELLWMLNGLCGNVRPLQNLGIKIWDKWADPETGDLGPIYGVQWNRSHQMRDALKEIQRNPGSTRALIDAWNPVDLPVMALPPCHFAHQLTAVPVGLPDRDQHLLSLDVFQRSCDVLVGLPYNMAFYGLLLQVYANRLNHEVQHQRFSVGPVNFHISHAHIYSQHLENPEVVDWVKLAAKAPRYNEDGPTWAISGWHRGVSDALTTADVNLLASYASHIRPSMNIRLEVIA